MLLKCRYLIDGPGPSEGVIEVTIEGGTEEVVVNKKSLKNGEIEVGAVIAVRGDFRLVELPRESVSGKWRVWVPSQTILETA